MATLKADIEQKLLKERKKLLSQLPNSIYNYYYIELGHSDEIRGQITYIRDTLGFLKYIGNNLNKLPKDLTNEDLNSLTLIDFNNYFDSISAYISTYTTKKGTLVERVRTNSLVSKARKLSALKNVFNYLESNKLIKDNPIKNQVRKKPDKTKISNRLDSEEVCELEEVLKNGYIFKSKHEEHSFNRLQLRNMCIFSILIYTGIRISELISLDINDVNLDKCCITVYRKNNKIQEIPYPYEVSKYIEEYITYRKSLKSVNKVNEKALFISQKHNRISSQMVRVLLKKYASKTNMNPSDISCHTFRRTFLSSFYNASKDIRMVAKIGGHSVATAAKYYADVEDERLREEISKFSYHK